MIRPAPEPQRVFYARLDHETTRKEGAVVDGDTIIVECLLCQQPHLKQSEVRLRFLEVDTPELKGDTKTAGEAAKAFTRTWLATASSNVDERWPLLVEFEKLDSFGRWLSYVWSKTTGECLNEAIIAAGHSERLPV